VSYERNRQKKKFNTASAMAQVRVDRAPTIVLYLHGYSMWVHPALFFIEINHFTSPQILRENKKQWFKKGWSTLGSNELPLQV
jgi:hypothetical protein